MIIGNEMQKRRQLPGGRRRKWYAHRRPKLSPMRRETVARYELKRVVKGDWVVKLATRMPRKYGECKKIVGDGPCPFVGCQYHLAIDVNGDSGSITHTWGVNADITDIAHTCALRQAARGGMTLQEVGERLNISRERARQIEKSALEKLADACGDDLREMQRMIDYLRAVADAREARRSGNKSLCWIPMRD